MKHLKKYIYINKSGGRKEYVQALKEAGECIRQNAENIVPNELTDVTGVSCSVEIGPDGISEVLIEVKQLATVQIAEEE